MRIHPATAPASQPLLIAELREHLRLSDTSDDPKLGSLIAAATAIVENYTDLFLVARTVDVFWDQWPRPTSTASAGFDHPLAYTGYTSPSRVLALPVRPVLAVQAVTVRDASGEEVTLDPSVYTLIPGLEPELGRSASGELPAPGVKTEGIRLALRVGFGESWNDVPADIHQALLLLITALYFQRGETGQSNAGILHTSGAKALLRGYRKQRL